MTTITGKIESAAGETLHATLDFTSRSTPQFPAGIIQTNTVKRIKSNATTGLFSVLLAAGNYRVAVKAKGLETTFNIAVPSGDDTYSIEELVTDSVATIPGDPPNELWNGIRRGHITFDPIDNPPTPSISLVNYVGGEGAGQALLRYRWTYETQDGETSGGTYHVISAFDGTTVTSGKAARVTSQVSPERVTSKTLWRHISGSHATGLWLKVATIAPAVSYYDDWESATSITNRDDASRLPELNTTAGIIYATDGQEILHFSIDGFRCLTAATFDEAADFSGQVSINSALYIPTSAGAGKVLTSDADGVATWQTPSGGGAVIQSVTGDPNGSKNANAGQFCWDSAATAFWMNPNTSGTSGWIQMI